MAAKRDYYEVLGVSRTATPDEVKKAYRKLAAANHPDRNANDPRAVERFKEAAEAFDVLGDEQKRNLYDRYGHDGVAAGRNGTGFNDISDVFNAFGDLFGDLFTGQMGGGRGQGGRRRPQRGDSLKTSIQIELREAAKGCTRDLEIERDEFCFTCDGSGARPGSTPETCSYCAGRGQVIQSQGFFRIQTTCPACQGSGEVVRDKCGACRGSGRERKRTRLEVKVPPGVDTGMQLCLRGEGDPGANGGPRGDLYVDIHVAEHPFFHRDGLDLTCRVPISFTQAVLGTEFEIPLLEGRHPFTVPAGTQPGEVFRLRGKGMPDTRSRRHGDLLVEVQVEIPRKLNEKQQKLIRELAELEKKHVSPQQKSFFERLKEYFIQTESPESGE
jgi:molecular chaperone DnaJ